MMIISELVSAASTFMLVLQPSLKVLMMLMMIMVFDDDDNVDDDDHVNDDVENVNDDDYGYQAYKSYCIDGES